MRVILAFLKRDLLNEVSYRLSFILELVSIVPMILLFFFLSRLFGDLIPDPLRPYGGDYFSFVLIGIAFQSYLRISLGSLSKSMREAQLSGTLEAILTTPVRLPQLIMGSMAYSFVFNSTRILIYLVLGGIFFSAEFQWNQLPLVFLIIALTVGAFSALGLISAGFIVLFKRGDPLTWAFSVASWLLGGVYYPVSVLPGWVQKLAQIVPMTHSLESLRLVLLQGRGIHDISYHLIILAVWCVIGVYACALWFRYALGRARLRGSLGQY